MTDSITLKWGSLKAWHLESDAAQETMQRYLELGSSMSAALQHDTDEQKAIICELIDIVDSDIYNDWSGEVMTKDEAKSYVMGYGK